MNVNKGYYSPPPSPSKLTSKLSFENSSNSDYSTDSDYEEDEKSVISSHNQEKFSSTNNLVNYQNIPEIKYPENPEKLVYNSNLDDATYLNTLLNKNNKNNNNNNEKLKKQIQVDINDKRYLIDFKGITFSNFKKSDVKKELLNSLQMSKIEPACYWSAELICAGHFNDLWDLLIHFFAGSIHLSNAKIGSYLEMRLNNFNNLINNGYKDILLSARNNQKIRVLFCEVICVLCDAKRKHNFSPIKIKKDDLNIVVIRDKFKAPSTHYGEEIFGEEDPKELFPFINELAYSLSIEGRNPINACYWIEWIIEYENCCKQNKEKLLCGSRQFAKVDFKFKKEIIWIIIDLFLYEASKRNILTTKIMKSLVNLFCFNYSKQCYKKRKSLLYFAIALLCENYILEREIIKHSSHGLINTIKSNINSVYKQLKKNEVSIGTEYLWLGLKTTSLEDTLEKLDLISGTYGNL